MWSQEEVGADPEYVLNIGAASKFWESLDLSMMEVTATIGHKLQRAGRTSCRAASRRPEASWRKMKLPCEENGESLVVKAPTGTGLRWTFYYEDGMTLGMLHEGMLKLKPVVENYYAVKATNGTRSYERRQALKRVREECAREDLWDCTMCATEFPSRETCFGRSTAPPAPRFSVTPGWI